MAVGAGAVPADVGTPPAAIIGGARGDEKKSASKTVTDTIIGEHEHTIIGYSLVKGIGDGEPIASERFTVGGHEWVLLFYPDGKKSSSTEGNIGGAVAAAVAAHAGPPPAANGAPEGGPPALPAPIPPPPGDRNAAANGAAPANPAAAPPNINAGPMVAVNPHDRLARERDAERLRIMGEARAAAVAQANQLNAAQHAAVIGYPQGQVAGPQIPPPPPQHVIGQHVRREQSNNEYAALFVALIGESDSPQGVVNTSDGRVVRAFHRFTLVDQSGQGRDLMKGRSRQQGAVKISCARQDPNARNCHGYRKFVKRSVLENQNNGYLVNDTIVIKYTIELVVSTGGALTRQPGPNLPKLPVIQVPPPSLGVDLVQLLESREGTDITFKVEDEELPAHSIILTARSPVFRALLNSDMREVQEGVITIEDIRPQVFNAMLHFIYKDALPEELEGSNLDVAMAQHLLVAADRYQLSRLRRICERRLCETVEVETVATTLSLSEQNHAEELKRVCLEFVSRNLQAVMISEGYQHMVTSCPQLQAELLHVIAVANERHGTAHRATRHAAHRAEYAADVAAETEARRVRQRRE